MKPVSTIVVVVFALVAVVHLLRIIQGWEVIVNGITMPLWVSVVGAIIAGGLPNTLYSWQVQERKGFSNPSKRPCPTNVGRRGVRDAQRDRARSSLSYRGESFGRWTGCLNVAHSAKIGCAVWFGKEDQGLV